MKIARYSLFYLATYLTLGGIAFLFVPTFFTNLMFSNVVYQEIPLRLAGMFCLLLGIVVIQIIHYRIDQLYLTSVIARLFALVALVVFYFQTHNPLFISLFLLVFVGVVLTSTSLYIDRKKNTPNVQEKI